MSRKDSSDAEVKRHSSDLRHALVAEAVQRFGDRQQPVGMIVGVLPQRSGQPWVFPYGATAEGGEEPKVTTLWQVGSLTKTFTATCLAQGVAHRGLHLEQAAQDLAPKGVLLPTYDTWDSSTPMRLVDLATHSAGLPLDPRGVPAEGGYSVEEMYRYLDLYALGIEPAKNWNYSNTGFGLLSNLLVENSRADGYQEMVRELLALGELPMPDTLLHPDEEQKHRRALPYLQPGQRARWRTDTWPAFDGSGALYSTLHDVLVWLDYNLGRRRSTLDDLLPLLQTVWFSQGTHRMGLAWEQGALPSVGEIWAKGGNTTGFTSYTAFSRELDAGATVLCNSAWVWGQPLIEEILTILGVGHS